MNRIKESVSHTKSVGLQLTGMSFKIMKEGKVTPDKLSLMNDLTDSVIEAADTILKEAEEMDVKMTDRGKKLESVKKELAGCKRNLSEAFLAKDMIVKECKKVKEERDALEEEVKILRGNQEDLKEELGNSQKSLLALSFGAQDSDEEQQDIV